MERFTPTQKEEAIKYGGSDFDEWEEYLKVPDPNYCDKLNHAERSMANDNGQHQEHWKNEIKQ